jgi:hypothetical protein
MDAPALSIADLTPATLCTGRLSITTISLGIRVGTRNCSTYWAKVSPFMAPSMTSGAVIRSFLSAASSRDDRRPGQGQATRAQGHGGDALWVPEP